MCEAQVDFANNNTVLMLEIWQTFVDLSAASGAPCVAKLLRAPSCSVTPLAGDAFFLIHPVVFSSFYVNCHGVVIHSLLLPVVLSSL